MAKKTSSPQPQAVDKKNKELTGRKKTNLPGMETSKKVKEKLKRAERDSLD